MKILIANSVGVDEYGNHIVHFPSRWSSSVGKTKWFTYYPYELAYLSSLLKRETTCRIKMVDGNLLKLNADEYVKLLKAHCPDWLIMEPATITYKEDLRVALALKKEFGTKLIFAGQHAATFPKETLADGIDYVCLGEYEYTVLDIVKGLPQEKIPGLYPNGQRVLLDINDLPFPEDDDISRWDYTGIGGSDYKEIEMFASRGCPMSCVFCVCRNIYYGQPNWRPRKIPSIIEEIKYLRAKYPGMEGVFFDEEDHNASREFIFGLTGAIKDNGLDCLKYNAMCGYWTLDREMIQAMRSAGYYKLRIGIETASEAVAKGINKKIDIPRLKSVLRLAKELGMKMYGTFTIGAPQSTKKEDLKTVALIKELVDKGLLDDLQISICTPQPGTPFYDWALSNGYLISKDWREYDGMTSSVVSYPRYANKEIEKVFNTALYTYSGARKRQQLRRTFLKALFLLWSVKGCLKLGRIAHEWLRGVLIPKTKFLGGYFFLRPRLIGIEPTNRCNLACVMCVRKSWDKQANPLGDMPADLFRNKILPFINSFQTVNLQCLGEPLLAEPFFMMVKSCKGKGSRVIFTTNGIMLKEYARQLINSAVDAITISIDGVKSLKKVRGIEIGPVIEGIRGLQDAARSSGKPPPELNINFVAMRDNLEDLPDVVDLARTLEIKAITVIQAVIHSKELLEQSIFNHLDIARKYFDLARDKARESGVRLSLPPLEEMTQPCIEPFTTLYINWNGDVRPCCIATINEKDTLKLGNLKDSSLSELWNGPIMRKLRLSLLRGDDLNAFCRNCSLRAYSLKTHTRILDNA